MNVLHGPHVQRPVVRQIATLVFDRSTLWNLHSTITDGEPYSNNTVELETWASFCRLTASHAHPSSFVRNTHFRLISDLENIHMSVMLSNEQQTLLFVNAHMPRIFEAMLPFGHQVAHQLKPGSQQLNSAIVTIGDKNHSVFINAYRQRATQLLLVVATCTNEAQKQTFHEGLGSSACLISFTHTSTGLQS